MLLNSPNLFDAALSREARDLALQSVSSHSSEFMIVALHAISQLPSGSEWTGEDIRKLLTERAICPEHNNAFGALINTAIKKKLLTPTGRFVRMTAVRSHSRKTEVYAR